MAVHCCLCKQALKDTSPMLEQRGSIAKKKSLYVYLEQINWEVEVFQNSNSQFIFKNCENFLMPIKVGLWLCRNIFVALNRSTLVRTISILIPRLAQQRRSYFISSVIKINKEKVLDYKNAFQPLSLSLSDSLSPLQRNTDSSSSKKATDRGAWIPEWYLRT